MMNKDFLKDVLAEKKRLIALKDVIFVNVPKYDEISVKNVWPMIQQDKELMAFFPEKLPKGRMPDRAYTFNVLNTLREDYVAGIIKHAQQQRNTAADNSMQAQFIRVTPAWQEQLEKIPFVSSKFIRLIMFAESRGTTVHLLKSGSKPVMERKKRKTYELGAKLVPEQAYDASQQRQASNDRPDEDMFEDVTHKVRSKKK